MDNKLELLKKLKALADRGVGGEALNAKDMLEKALKKHGLTIEDIEGEKKQDYFFKVKKSDERLLHQICKRVNRDINCYDIPAKQVRYFGFKSGFMVTCTPSEFIEIDQMFHVYSRLLKEEMEVFYHAFLSANDLLVKPRDSEKKKITDFSDEEIEEHLRIREIANKIKKETIRKQLKQ